VSLADKILVFFIVEYLVLIGVYIYFGEWVKVFYWIGVTILTSAVLFME